MLTFFELSIFLPSFCQININQDLVSKTLFGGGMWCRRGLVQWGECGPQTASVSNIRQRKSLFYREEGTNGPQKLYDLILGSSCSQEEAMNWFRLRVGQTSGTWGGEKLNQRLNCKHFVTTDHCQKAIQLIIYEATWEI